jgi:hypothetical protein
MMESGGKAIPDRQGHAALPPGGALIVYEAMIDDARESNLQGLLMSLTMLIETRAVRLLCG